MTPQEWKTYHDDLYKNSARQQWDRLGNYPSASKDKLMDVANIVFPKEEDAFYYLNGLIGGIDQGLSAKVDKYDYFVFFLSLKKVGQKTEAAKALRKDVISKLMKKRFVISSDLNDKTLDSLKLGASEVDASEKCLRWLRARIIFMMPGEEIQIPGGDTVSRERIDEIWARFDSGELPDLPELIYASFHKN